MTVVEPNGTFEDEAGSADGPQEGERAPDFLVQAANGRVRMSVLAAQAGKVVLITQDSYQFHPN